MGADCEEVCRGSSITEFVEEIVGCKKCRIAILLPTFSRFDGVGKVVEQQSEELSGAGHHVSIFTLEADMSPPKGVALLRLRAPRNLLINRVYRVLFVLDPRVLVWASRLKGFDVIIAHQYPMTYVGYIAKKLHGVRYVFYNHGQAYQGIVALSSLERVYYRLMCALEDMSIKNADSAVCVSEFLRRELKERVGMDGFVIYNKVDERFRRGLDGSSIRRRYGIGNDPLVLYVGRIVPHKGVHILIEAFRRVRREIPNAKLLIVGRHYYVEYSKRLRGMVDESVIFAEDVPDDELPLYYAACDVYATCSLWEGFNLPIAEAQACGKPVVAFRVGSHPEVVDGHGTLVEAGDVVQFSEACIRKLRGAR